MRQLQFLLYNFFGEFRTNTVIPISKCVPDNLTIIRQKVNYIWQLTNTLHHSHDTTYITFFEAVNVVNHDKKPLVAILKPDFDGWA